MTDDARLRPATARAHDGTAIHYVECGDPAAPPVVLGPHCYAVALEGGSPGDAPAETTPAWVEALVDGFRLIVADYPRGVGKTGNPLGRGYTAAVAVDDFTAILDAAEIERAGLVGYSYGGAVALQVACRCDRLSAVAIGGWPPLDAPFARLSEIATGLPASAVSEPGASVAAFYASLIDWPERDEVPKLDIPRLAFMGTEDAFDAPNATLSERLRRVEDDLRALDWEIAWIDGADHLGAMDARVSAPVVRPFLERALCESA